jgi:hypothetical protein
MNNENEMKSTLLKNLLKTHAHKPRNTRIQRVSFFAHVFLSIPNVTHHFARLSAFVFTSSIQKFPK